MNRGFKTYYKEGYKASKETLKKKGNLLRYNLFIIMSFLTYLVIIFKPVMDMAKTRLLKLVRNDKEITISKAIQASDNAKSFWTCLIGQVVKGLMIASVILAIILVSCLLFLLGIAIYTAASLAEELKILPFIFAAPGAILIIIILCFIPIATAPIGYVVDTNPNMGVSKVLFASVDALKKDGKRTIFVSYLLESLIKIVFILIPVIPAIVFSQLSVDITEAALLITLLIVILIVDIVVYILVMSKFMLAFKVSRLLLLEDLVLDNFNGTKRLTGIEFKVDNKNTKNKLEMLFDSTNNRNISVLSDLREINGTVINNEEQQETTKADSEEFTKEELEVLNAIPQSDLGDMQDLANEINEKIKEEAALTEETNLEAEDSKDELEENNVATDSNLEEKVEAIIEEEIIEEELELPNSTPDITDGDNGLANEVEEAEMFEEEIEEISLTPETSNRDDSNTEAEEVKLSDEEIEAINSIPSAEYDNDTKELLDELRAFEEMHQDLTEEELEELEQSLQEPHNEIDQEESNIEDNNLVEADNELLEEEESVEEEYKEQVTDEPDVNEVSQLSDEELELLNAIPETDSSVVEEEIMYVDEDGNPINIDEHEFVEEEIVYVDEDGNPIEPENIITETDEFENFVNNLDELSTQNEEVEPTEEVVEKPKRGRKKKAKKEDGE